VRDYSLTYFYKKGGHVMKKYKCFHCKKETEESNLVKKQFSRKDGREYHRKFHEECLVKYEEKESEKDERRADLKKWDDLYQYIKKDLFGYDQGQKLSQYLIKRILGLRSGSFAPSKNKKVFLSKDGYPYEVILMTCKVKKMDILNAISDKSKVNDETHRDNLIMVIIQNSINDVYLKMKDKEESDKRVEKIDLSSNVDAEFKNKSKIKDNKVANRLKHLF
jgi:hypothetical protein